MPHHHMVLPHYVERSKEIDIEAKIKERDNSDDYLPNSFESHTTSEDIPLLLPQEVGEIYHTLEKKIEDHESNPDKTHLYEDPSEMHSGFSDDSEMQSSDDLWETDEPDTHNHASFEHDHGQIGERLSCRCQVNDHPSPDY